jgi:hypothetical protein
MSATAHGTSDYVLRNLVRKLSPGRFPGMPPTLAADRFRPSGKVLPSSYHSGRRNRRRDHARSGRRQHICETYSWQLRRPELGSWKYSLCLLRTSVSWANQCMDK